MTKKKAPDNVYALGKIRSVGVLRSGLPEYPFPFALRGIYDDIWGTTPVPGDPTEDKYPHRNYPVSLKTKAGTTYELLSSLLSSKRNTLSLVFAQCKCGNGFVVPEKFFPNAFSDCGCCTEYTADAMEKSAKGKNEK